MTTQDAFKEMIEERGVHNKLGITSQQVRYFRYEIKTGKVSIDKMEELLLKYGYTKQPEVWKRK